MWTAEAVLVCALTLLTRGSGSFPPIVLVASRPPGVSPRAEAFARPGDRTIYLLTSTAAFRDARRARYSSCGDTENIRKIASVLVHEEWHVAHGADEEHAYAAQLTALSAMGAGPGTPVYSQVRRSMRVALEEAKRDTALRMARVLPPPDTR